MCGKCFLEIDPQSGISGPNGMLVFVASVGIFVMLKGCWASNGPNKKRKDSCKSWEERYTGMPGTMGPQAREEDMWSRGGPFLCFQKHWQVWFCGHLPCAGSIQTYVHLCLPTSKTDRHYHSHFTGEKTEAQKSIVWDHATRKWRKLGIFFLSFYLFI